jgi:capsular polysaccharide transport system permease protein
MTPDSVRAEEMAERPRRKRRFPRAAVTILLPALLGAVYFGGLAEDRYLAEAKFSIREEDQRGAALGVALGGILGMTGGSSRLDQLLIRDYVLSADMMRKIGERFDLAPLMAARGFDLLWRLPAGAPVEDLLERWRRLVSVTYDEASAITTVRVQSFDRAMAEPLLTAVLEEAKSFVNQLSKDIARQQIDFAEAEANRTRQRRDEALETLNRFQKSNLLLDPRADGQALAQTIGQLEGEIAKDRSQIAQLGSYLAGNNPKIAALRSKVAAMHRQIAELRGRMASGSQAGEVADHLEEFEKLKSDLAFAETTYTASLASLEAATASALREHKHMLLVARPFQPEITDLPRRAYGAFLVALVAALAHLILAAGEAILREHLSLHRS